MLEHGIWNVAALLTQVINGTAEINRIPMNNGAHDEVEAGSAERLAVKGPVSDFPAFMEEYRPLELVGGFALVETGLATSAQGVARIPFNHKQ